MCLQGRALVATEGPAEIVTLASGVQRHPRQCSATYIFPGVGLGVLISRCTKLRDEQLIAAAEAVAKMVRAWQ